MSETFRATLIQLLRDAHPWASIHDNATITRMVFVNRRGRSDDLQLTSFGNTEFSKIIASTRIAVSSNFTYNIMVIMRLRKKMKFPWHLGNDCIITTYGEEESVLLKLVHGDINQFLEM